MAEAANRVAAAANAITILLVMVRSSFHLLGKAPSVHQGALRWNKRLPNDVTVSINGDDILSVTQMVSR